MKPQLQRAFEEIEGKEIPTLETHSMLILSCLDFEIKPYTLHRSMIAQRDNIVATFDLIDGHTYEVTIKPLFQSKTKQ